ncbi:MAG: DUF4292 domain-containing protein [Dysgonamonadaceae bacterium]|jgi:hypothetical protein|nr:DUF4292 domain-containing protein [Dysgonamonadaceae bacterium]
MKRYLIYSTLIVLLFAASCKTGKEPASIALPAMTAEERINHIIQSGTQYNNLSSSLKLTIRQGEPQKETTVDAQLRMVKNEAIQLSLRIPILGSEAFRMVITPDKLLIIDRLNKQYLSETLQDIRKQMPFDVDYYSLEALLSNRLFIAGKKEITPADYALFQTRNDRFRTHILYTESQKITYDFESDYTHRIQSARMTQATGASYLQCSYTDWGLASDNRTFPMTFLLQLHTPEGIYELNGSHKSVLINTEFAVDYQIPNKYKQVTLEQVVRLIKKEL